MALPAATRHRWKLTDGGTVDIVDLGEALVIVPAEGGGLRSLVAQAVVQAGGYASLAASVAADDPELA